MARLEGAYEQINLRLGRLEDDMRGLRGEVDALLGGVVATIVARLV